MAIEEHGPKITDGDVRELETYIGSALPDQYRLFLLTYNGGIPTPDVVDVQGLAGGEATVQVFFGIDVPIESERVDLNYESLHEMRLEAWQLPIACDGFGVATPPS